MPIGPDKWGVHGWKFIHYITMGYPNVPSEEDKLKYYNFFHSLKYVIPCSICGAHFKENLEKTPLEVKFLNLFRLYTSFINRICLLI